MWRNLSDCQAALCAAAGHLQQEATGITAALIAVQALRRHAVPRAQVYEYVPGHSGVVPNEIADVLSKIAASADVSSCGLQVPDLTAMSWLGCGANKLAWVSVALRSCLGDVSMPPINQQDLGHDCYHAGLSTADLFAPFTPPEVQLPDRLPSDGPASEQPKPCRLWLRLLTFNVLSLLDKTAG